MAEEDTIVMDGWLRKRGSRVSLWGDRYFVLKGSTLSYYLKQSDSEPKGVFTLTSSCSVSPIRTESNKKKKIYIFEISWPHEEEHDESDASKTDNGVSPKLKDPKKKPTKGKKDGKDDKKMSGMKVAALAVGGVVVGTLTSGIGLLAGMTVVGMGAGGGGGTNTTTTTQTSDKDKQLVLQCENFRVAENWVHAIEAQIRELGDGYFPYGSSFAPVVPKKHTPPPEVRMEEVEEWAMSSKWKLACVKDGNRLFELASSSADISSVPPCMKINVGMNGSVSEVFKLVMTLPNSCRTGVVRNLRFVEAIDSNTDVIHLTLEPIYLEPTWTAPRDFCLTRYWKQSPDGSFVVCLDSTTHPDCQLCTGYIRGEMHATYFISPPKEDDDEDEPMECMLTFICQVDPKGWIWRSYGYQHRFVQEMMMHVLDIRDAIDAERFVKVTFDPVVEVKGGSSTSVPSDTTDNTNTAESSGTLVGLGTIPPPTLPKEMWDDVDASTFRIRGKSYLTDNVKASSAPSLFKLIAVDVIEVPEPTRNIASHPRNRVALAHARGDKFWCFVVNIMVPGSTNVCFVMYYLGDKTLFEQDTPFARLAKPFFFGNDDEFRNNRFKLIPKVVDGNMIIKMAVKDTPTLLGNKLKQYYFREDHYFELDVDVGSSSVARNVVGLAIGYSKAIVVDMGLCLQGNEEDELPEILMGGCSCIHVDMSLGKKL